LTPVPPALGPFAIFAQPVSGLTAVTGIVVVSGLLLVASWWQAIRLEVSYATE
jgi:hypothetical protein